MDSDEQRILERKKLEEKKAEVVEIYKQVHELKQNLSAEDSTKFNDLQKRKAELTLELDDIDNQLQSGAGAIAQITEKIETLENLASSLITEISYLEQKISSDK
tara:strand:+ start:77 stop:388 length:312 start_codon:yes stop_codon:yes gene_type:complete